MKRDMLTIYVDVTQLSAEERSDLLLKMTVQAEDYDGKVDVEACLSTEDVKRDWNPDEIPF